MSAGPSTPIQKTGKWAALKETPQAKPKDKDATSTVLALKYTTYPPNSQVGTPGTLSDNMQIGVKLRKGVPKAKEAVYDAWATSKLDEKIGRARVPTMHCALTCPRALASAVAS